MSRRFSRSPARPRNPAPRADPSARRRLRRRRGPRRLSRARAHRRGGRRDPSLRRAHVGQRRRRLPRCRARRSSSSPARLGRASRATAGSKPRPWRTPPTRWGAAARRCSSPRAGCSSPPSLRAPQHRYVVRAIDRPAEIDALPGCKLILARGPFSLADELALMRASAIEALVTKNSGGRATYAKIEAARALRIEVVIVRRPAAPEAGDARRSRRGRSPGSRLTGRAP